MEDRRTSRKTKKNSDIMPSSTTSNTPRSASATGTKGRKRNVDATVAPEVPPPTPVVPAPPPTEKVEKKVTKRQKKAASEVSSVAPSSVATTTVAPSTDANVAAVKKGRKPKAAKKRHSRTPSSYVLFSMEHRKVVIEKNPDLTLGEVSKLCGSAWKDLNETERKPWMEKAEDLKNRRKSEIAEEVAKDPPKKKRTPSSYLLFAMEHRKIVLDANPGMNIGSVSKLCGAAWAGLDETAKETWKEKANALKNV